jgi:hypothetical protein
MRRRRVPVGFVTIGGFQIDAVCGTVVHMKGRWILRLVLVWLVAAGLVAAPIVAPSFAQAAADTEMSAMMADMPCCPDGMNKQAPEPSRCKDCAAMILCAPQVAQAVVAVASALPVASGAFAELTPGVSRFLDDVAPLPPAKPPRS